MTEEERQEARRKKAEQLVSINLGSHALEGIHFDEEVKQEMIKKTVRDLECMDIGWDQAICHIIEMYEEKIQAIPTCNRSEIYQWQHLINEIETLGRGSYD